MKTALSIMTVILLVCCSPYLCEDKAISGPSGPLSNISEKNSEGLSHKRYGEMSLSALPENQGKLDMGAVAGQDMITIVDDPDDTTTWLQRWDEGHPAPGGIPPAGWSDVAGWRGFETYQINVIWSGSDMHFQIFTDFPETGYKDGTPYGYPSGGLYQLADLAFDLNLDGVWETAIALIDHGAIPADPSEPAHRQPPGYGQSADNFVKGNIYSVTDWFSPGDIHYYHFAYAGLYDMNAPKLPFSRMRHGTQIGEAEITYTNLGATNPKYRIDIILRGINTHGQWNRFSIYWGTGTCANDVITGTWEPFTIPTMNEWGLVIFGSLMAFSALWVLRKKIRWQGHKSGI